MSRIKVNIRKVIWKPYLAIYLYLFICVLALNGCAQRYSADSKSVKQSETEDWFGSTCPVTQVTYDKSKAGNQQFKVCQPESWGAAKNVVRIKHLYISSQPDFETLDIARKNGVELVLNLRDPSEYIWDEKIAAQQSGLIYYNIPISASGEAFNPDAIKQISALVQQHKDQKILLHCSSGNRASAWLAIHLIKDHNMPSDRAISLAKQAGLTSPLIKSRVKQFILDN
jgi:protein tyrosine phosphatase (PTP) superfamily phosphohydrolase (DUF442 family)